MSESFDGLPNDWHKPEWEKKERVHCWRNYISDELVALWETFYDVQKQAIAKNAEEIASREEWGNAWD